MNKQHQTKQPTKFFLYARKSSEAEDKQVASIDAQIEELTKIARIENLEIVKVFSEAQSAKAPGRLIFNEMIQRVYNREAQGIVCWKLDRLARNPVDGGTINWMLQQGAIQHIRSFERSYYPTDNVLMMSVEFGMANQFVRDLSTNVKRGFRAKYEMGYPPGIAKIGYLNDYGKKGQRKIKADPERFELVRQLYLEFLTGKYSVRKLHEYAKNTLGLKNIQRDKEGGNPIALSHLHLILKDPFPAGFFFALGGDGERQRYEVNASVPRMITEEQYWLIQTMLGGKGNPRPKTNKNEFPYIGRTRCGTCGGAVTAEHKHQLICSECKTKFAYKGKTHCPKCEVKISDMKNPKYLHYIYYHCTKRRTPTCPERSVYQSDIDEYLAGYFENNLKISPDLRDWSIKHLNELTQNDKQNEFERRDGWLKQKEAKDKEYLELIRMKTRGAIDEDDFFKMKTSLKTEIENITRTLSEMGSSDNSALERAKKAFELAVGISEVFRGDDYNEKVEALATLRSNLTLKEKKLSLSTEKLYSILIAGIISARKESPSFEPANWSLNKGKTPAFADVCPSWLRGQDSNLRPIDYTCLVSGLYHLLLR